MMRLSRCLLVAGANEKSVQSWTFYPKARRKSGIKSSVSTITRVRPKIISSYHHYASLYSSPGRYTQPWWWMISSRSSRLTVRAVVASAPAPLTASLAKLSKNLSATTHTNKTSKRNHIKIELLHESLCFLTRCIRNGIFRFFCLPDHRSR